MKSMLLAAFALSIATLVGCAGETAPSADEAAAAPAAPAGGRAQAALDQMQKRIVLDADGNLVAPRSEVRYSVADITMDEALAKVDPQAQFNTAERSMCAGGYAGPLLVCCTVGGQCCLRSGQHFECF